MKMNKAKISVKILAALFLAATFVNVSCYSWYDSKIDMDTKTPKINLGELFYKEKEITSLSTPNQLIVSKGVYSGTIKLHWDEVPYATSYRIERAIVEPDLDGTTYAVPEEGDFEVLNKYVYSNNFSDVILSSPSDANKEYQNRYYYRISAENIKMGLESSEFTQITAENSGWLLTPPSAIDAAKGENPDYIEINWKAVPKAYKYLIYRSEKSNGLGMELLDTVTGDKTSYKNELTSPEKGMEFYYKVCAVLENGSQSAFTGLAMGYSAKEGAPVAPSELTVENAKAMSVDELEISWGTINPSVPANTITYNLFRTSSEDSIYTLVANNISSTSYNDISIQKPGLKYYYYVQAVETKADTNEKIKSPFSKTGPESENPVTGWLLSAPGNCEITDSKEASKVYIRWTPSIGYEEVDYIYNIYACQTYDGDFELIENNIGSDELELGEDGYYTKLVPKHQFYKITAINALNKTLESAKSEAVAPCPNAPENVTATKTSALDGLQNYEPNTNGVYPVMISWSAPANETPFGYYVYRSTKPDSAFRKITDAPVTDGVYTFIDNNETARPGTIYYYKVVSLNILKQGKNTNEQTEASRGYGALTRDQWFREYNKTVKRSQAKLTLMHKDGTNALGSESIKGDLKGGLSYNAKMDGLGARIIMRYENYADYYVANEEALGFYFLLDGESNTSANMSANGKMDGTVTASNSGMYPGYAKYDKLEIKGGGAGGGYYIVSTMDKSGKQVLGEGNVDWTVGEE